MKAPYTYHLIAGMTIQEAGNRPYDDLYPTFPFPDKTEHYGPVANLTQPVGSGTVSVFKHKTIVR